MCILKVNLNFLTLQQFRLPNGLTNGVGSCFGNDAAKKMSASMPMFF